MQIFKISILACAVATAAAPALSRAEDNDAQAQARAALEQKIKEIEGGSPAQPPAPAEPATPPQPAPAPRKVEAPAAAPKFSETPAPQIPNKRNNPVLIAPAPASSDDIEKAREAMHQRLQEIEAQQKSAEGEAPAMVQPAPTLEQPVAPPTEVKPATVAAPAGSDDIEKARAAMHQKMQEIQAPAAEQPANAEAATAPTTTQVKSAKAAEADAKAQAAATEKARKAQEKAAAAQAKAEAKMNAKDAAAAPGPKVQAPAALAPLEGPASPLAASKEQRLQDLLQDYKTDKITAVQYHEQRAKILAEP